MELGKYYAVHLASAGTVSALINNDASLQVKNKITIPTINPYIKFSNHPFNIN